MLVYQRVNTYSKRHPDLIFMGKDPWSPASSSKDLDQVGPFDRDQPQEPMETGKKRVGFFTKRGNHGFNVDNLYHGDTIAQ